MKTPEEIKKGLECCHINDEDLCECEYCPYSHRGHETAQCDINLAEDALTYIRQLEPLKILVKRYIQKHKITCSESIWQMDKPQVDAIVLANELCKLVGYMEEDDA